MLEHHVYLSHTQDRVKCSKLSDVSKNKLNALSVILISLHRQSHPLYMSRQIFYEYKLSQVMIDAEASDPDALACIIWSSGHGCVFLRIHYLALRWKIWGMFFFRTYRKKSWTSQVVKSIMRRFMVILIIMQNQK